MGRDTIKEGIVKVASIVLCAGVGSRLKSGKNKILHEVCGRSMAYWPIKLALETTAHEPIVVLNYQAEAVEDKLRYYFHDDMRVALQKKPDGTGGAVRAALDKLDADCASVLVLCGDSPLIKKESLERLLLLQQKTRAPIALLSALANGPTNYGRIVRNHDQQIIKIIEEREATEREKAINEVNAGIYVFDVEFLRKNIDKITNKNSKEEYYLTDLVQIYGASGLKQGPIESHLISLEEMQGINDRCQLAYAEQVMNRRLLNRWMLEGVTIIDPATTYIEASVRLSKDVVLYPGVHLRGETHIGEGCIIENGSIIKDTVIEKYARVLPYTWCDQAYIGERCEVGPFARLRPDARLENDVKIGNFVEVKRSRIKSGTKAGHLAYIGDAEIGEGCNIGAGAITCNYDGNNKHRTVIGEGSFIGSNATLVAPLSIGTDAYIAGGSVINKEVPNDTLALGRAHQVNKQRLKSNVEEKKLEHGMLS